VRARTIKMGKVAERRIVPTAEVAESRRQESIEKLAEIVGNCQRYERALRRIAESDDEACPHVKVALEALNPTA
jgi:hypothetical protein